jgi:virginiamycin B lyase
MHFYRDRRIRWPTAIAVGPDSALWFINGEDGTSIGRITTSGRVTMYRDRRIHGAADITTGPDGALWFTNGSGYAVSSIGRLSTDGRFRFFTDRRIKAPGAITVGPDGALWFCNDYSPSSIGRITVAGAVITYRHRSLDTPLGIVPGPDHALWFVTPRLGMAGGDGRIWRITTIGTITPVYDDGVGGKVIDPHDMVVGPDKAFWFLDHERINRLTPTADVHVFTGKIESTTAITQGPDGALWFTNQRYDRTPRGDSIGRITTLGNIRYYTDPHIKQPSDVTAGPGRTIWFTNISDNSIGRITVPG